MPFPGLFRRLLTPLLGVVLAAVAMPAAASLVFLTPGAAINPGPTLTFDDPLEHGIGDPSYTLSGGSFDGLGIRFASYFAGQTLGFGLPVTIPGITPSGPLTLVTGDVNSYATIVYDGGIGSFVMAGGPTTFFQPISILFDSPVPALAFTFGEVFAIGATHVDVFDADGNVLGSYTNDAIGFLSIGIANVGGGPNIAGLSIHANSFDGTFGIDNLYVVEGFDVPEPVTTLIFAVAIAGLACARRSNPATAPRLRTAAAGATVA